MNADSGVPRKHSDARAARGMFDVELVAGVWWLAQGYHRRELPAPVTKRLLRAALRKFNVLVTRESAAVAAARRSSAPCVVKEDHPLPLRVVVAQLLERPDLDRDALKPWLIERLALVALTKHEHDVVLKNARLASAMPSDWNETDVLARYTATGIETTPCEPRRAQSRGRRRRSIEA